MKQFILAIALITAVSACDKEPEATPEAPTEAPKTAPKTDKTSEPTAAKETAKKKTWELKIDGLADLSGSAVIASNMGKFHQVSLMGADGTATLQRLKTTDADPYALQITIPNGQQHCIYRADNKGLSSGITVSASGKRTDVKGEITCNGVGANKTEKKKHALSGYFQQK